MHYKTIQFNLKLPLNIHIFFCGGGYAGKVIFFGIFQILPPPPPNPKNGSTPLDCVYHHFSGVELRFPNDFQGDFLQMINAKLF